MELFDEMVVEVIEEMKKMGDGEVDEESGFFDNVFGVVDELLELGGDEDLLVKL
ncbi:hypothetical protein [Paenibacillus xylanexedens]|uniref:hypothetical protein n=1 Tax=Paenibacillus xylanexedens TaxID=528191 RepID=UPI0016425740|nr:hypothetical protein [Paenibacillus xylanexedens]